MTSITSEIRKQGNNLFFISSHPCRYPPIPPLLHPRGRQLRQHKKVSGVALCLHESTALLPAPLSSLSNALKVTCLSQSCVIHIQHILLAWAGSVHMTGALLGSARQSSQTIPFFTIPHILCTGQLDLKGQQHVQTSGVRKKSQKIIKRYVSSLYKFEE